MRARARSIALIVLVSAVAVPSAGAQRVSESRVAVTTPALPFEHSQQVAPNKDPMIAGVLSWLVPGVGSYYSGHSGHGTRHLAIHVASIVGIFAGAAAAIEECTYDSSNFNYDCSGGSFALYGVSLLVYFVNDIWSIFTAVGDARAWNANNSGGARPGRVVGELAPAIINLRDVKNADGSVEQRTGLQVFKLGY